MFSYFVVKKLKLHAPEMRLIQREDTAFTKVIETLNRIASSDKDIHVEEYLNARYIMIMQFIPSITFDKIDVRLSDIVFDISYTNGRERLFDIGRIYAVDSFLNFRERLPFPWNNTQYKELYNILFESSIHRSYTEKYLGRVFIINTSCDCFTNEPSSQTLIASYINQLEGWLKSVIADCNQIMKGEIDINRYKFESIKELKEVAKEKGGINGICALEITFGIIIGYYNIKQMGISILQRIFNKAKTIGIEGNKEDWKEQIDKTINMVYFKSVYEMLDNLISENIDTVSWVLQVTERYKVIEEFDDDNEEYEILFLDIDESYMMRAKEVISIPRVETPKERKPIIFKKPEEVPKEEVPKKEVPVVRKSCCCNII